MPDLTLAEIKIRCAEYVYQQFAIKLQNYLMKPSTLGELSQTSYLWYSGPAISAPDYGTTSSVVTLVENPTCKDLPRPARRQVFAQCYTPAWGIAGASAQGSNRVALRGIPEQDHSQHKNPRRSSLSKPCPCCSQNHVKRWLCDALGCSHQTRYGLSRH